MAEGPAVEVAAVLARGVAVVLALGVAVVLALGAAAVHAGEVVPEEAAGEACHEIFAEGVPSRGHHQTTRPAGVAGLEEQLAASAAADGFGAEAAYLSAWEVLQQAVRPWYVKCTCTGRSRHRLLPEPE